MSSQKEYTEYTVGTSTYMMPSHGHPSGWRGERSYECVACGLSFRESDIQWYKGKPYGVPCGCNKDIPSLIRLERSSRKSYPYESGGQ